MAASRMEIVARFQSLLALAVMVIALSVLSDSFFTAETGRNILRLISVNLCLSLGMTLVILTAGIDLSVGAVLALTGAVAARLLRDGVALPGTDYMLQFSPSGAILAAVLLGAALGWVNGTVITRLGVPAFVTTLGMLSIARGFTMLWTKGHTISAEDKLATLGTGAFARIPISVWIATGLTLACFVVARGTRFGRYVYAIGGNERAAVLSGLPVARVKRSVYTISGALAAVAGVMLVGRLNTAAPNAGVGYELDSIAAVVIGGTSLSGGRGSVVGTVIGCLTIGVLSTGLVLLGVSSEWQQVVKGVVIIAAVALDRRNIRAGA
jgi:ribose transport system permease protein